MKYRYELTIGNYFNVDDLCQILTGIVQGDTELECKHHLRDSYKQQIRGNFVVLKLYEIV